MCMSVYDVPLYVRDVRTMSVRRPYDVPLYVQRRPVVCPSYVRRMSVVRPVVCPVVCPSNGCVCVAYEERDEEARQGRGQDAHEL